MFWGFFFVCFVFLKEVNNQFFLYMYLSSSTNTYYIYNAPMQIIVQCCNFFYMFYQARKRLNAKNHVDSLLTQENGVKYLDYYFLYVNAKRRKPYFGWFVYSSCNPTYFWSSAQVCIIAIVELCQNLIAIQWIVKLNWKDARN